MVMARYTIKVAQKKPARTDLSSHLSIMMELSQPNSSNMLYGLKCNGERVIGYHFMSEEMYSIKIWK